MTGRNVVDNAETLFSALAEAFAANPLTVVLAFRIWGIQGKHSILNQIYIRTCLVSTIIQKSAHKKLTILMSNPSALE
jgi:hypothetical protein